MRIIHSDIRKGAIKIKIENLNDLWYLSSIIGKDDIVSGTTVRKIKIGGEDARSANVFKKHIFLKIKVEKAELIQEPSSLRVNGIIIEGPEDVSRGSYHTFNIEADTIITIEKEKWLGFQLQKLKEASSEKPASIMICVFDREEACIARQKGSGYEILTKLKGDVAKKADIEAKKGDFYVEILNIVKEYDEKYKFESIIMASPAFWKDELVKRIEDENLKKKIVMATCSGPDESSINEVLKRPELATVLKQDRIAKEINLVEELLQEISTQGKAVYGFNEVKNSCTAGAVEKILITDLYINKAKEQNKYNEIDYLLKMAESMKGEIFIISSAHEGGKKLDGLGGIAALLRYKLEY